MQRSAPSEPTDQQKPPRFSFGSGVFMLLGFRLLILLILVLFLGGLVFAGFMGWLVAR
jgi:hypothetical protein